MTIKKLTAEGRFECGLDDVVAGKVWAFVAVMSGHKSAPYCLGVAVANEPGYFAIPMTWCSGDSFNEMGDHADELNSAEGLDDLAAAKIVCSSMARRREPQKV